MDSLKFNLKGKTEPFTNWNFSVDFDPDFFDDTLFTQIDLSLLKQTEISDTLSVFGNTTPIDSLQTKLEIHNTITEIAPENIETEKNNLLSDNNAFLLVVLVSVMIVGILRFTRKEFFNNIFAQFFQPSTDKENTSGTVSNIYPTLILKILFLFNSSIFVFEIITLTDFELFHSGLIIIPIISIFLAIVFWVKNIVFSFIGYIFSIQPLIRSYINNSYMLSAVYAIVILPIIIIIPFLESTIQILMLKAGIYFFILLYIIMIWKGIKIIFRETYSLYYIILYLCALEILPLMFIVKSIL
ncbi:MAG: DUF4271 domain-containing protein [Marinilabiliaceae bacterium]|nr:DUF4271 domain-containing protein [Marinilabiliaceae bacterium]